MKKLAPYKNIKFHHKNRLYNNYHKQRWEKMEKTSEKPFLIGIKKMNK